MWINGEVHLADRIVSNSEILLGKPVIQGSRMPVYIIVGLVEAGQTPEEIVDDYPNLTLEDIAAAIAFDERERHHTKTRAL
jgi:uncharacterized protein (DUF433 family)